MEPVRVGPVSPSPQSQLSGTYELTISPHGSPEASLKRLRLSANSSGKTWEALL